FFLLVAQQTGPSKPLQANSQRRVLGNRSGGLRWELWRVRRRDGRRRVEVEGGLESVGEQADYPSLLAEAAQSECAPSMRAVKDNLAAPPSEKLGRSEGSHLGHWHISACQWVGG